MDAIDRGSLRPYLDHAEHPIESDADYAARIQNLLPQFPSDVLGQWFFDHWQQAAEWTQWLDYNVLEFSLQEWPTASIPLNDFGYEELLSGHLNRLTHGDLVTPRDERIIEYFVVHGTWPRPVIVLDSAQPMRARPPWMGSGRYYLLEGHHRVAVFRFALANGWKLQATHKLWLTASRTAV